MATLLKNWGTYWLRSGTGTAYSTFDIMGRVKVYLESQNNAANTSYIRVDHYMVFQTTLSNVYDLSSESTYRANQGSYGGTYQTKSKTVVDVTGPKSATEYFLGSTYYTVTHNSNGSGTLYVDGSIYLFIGVSGSSVTGTKVSSFSVGLPTIPRYANITYFNVTAGGLTSANVSYILDSACDAVQYSLSGGAWVDSGAIDGSFSIGGLSPGIQYSVKIRAKRTDSQLWTESSTSYITTVDIAKITNLATGFAIDIDIDVDVVFTNPSGSTTNVYFEAPNGTRIFTRSNVTSPYKITLSSDEKNTLYGLTNNTNKNTSIAIGVETVNGSTWSNEKSGIANITNANPTFTTFTYADTNPITKAITKLDTTMIKGYSTPKLTITTANKAIANKLATMVSYNLESTGIESISKEWSDTLTVEDTLSGILSSNLVVKAVDSRNNQTVVTYSPILIDYSVPVLTSASAIRTNNVDDETTLTFVGTYTNWSATYTDVLNSIQNAKYRYSSDGGLTWSGYTNVTLTTNTNGTYTFSGTISGDLGTSGFDPIKSFKIEIVITDKLASITSSQLTLNSAQPLIWKFKNDIKSILGIGKKPDTSLPHGSIDVLGEIWSAGVKLINTIINNTLTSTSVTEALAANQGKVLNDKIDTKLSSALGYQMMCGSSGAALCGAGTTSYLGLVKSTAGYSGFVTSCRGIISDLYVYTDGSPGSGQTYTCTMLANNVAQPVTCTIPAGTNNASDQAHSFIVGPNVRVCMKFVCSASAVGTTVIFGFKFTPTP